MNEDIFFCVLACGALCVLYMRPSYEFFYPHIGWRDSVGEVRLAEKMLTEYRARNMERKP